MIHDAFDTRLTLTEQQEEANEQKERFFREQRELAKKYQKVFSGKDGEEVWQDLKEQFLKFRSYLPGHNVNDACYFEGQKSVMDYINFYLSYDDE